MNCLAPKCPTEPKAPHLFCPDHWAQVPRAGKRLFWDEANANKRRPKQSKEYVRRVKHIVDFLAGHEIVAAIQAGKPLELSQDKATLSRLADWFTGRTTKLEGKEIVITQAAPVEPLMGGDGRIYVRNIAPLVEMVERENQR